MKRRWLAVVAAIAVFGLVGAACASNTGGGGGTTTPPASSATASPGEFGATEDTTIAAEVPSDIAAKGTLTVATDATYAPMEFIPPGQKAVDGADVDLGHAIGTVLGLKFDFVNAGFDTIIPGLASGKYDLGMSAFTDTKDREKTVDFVTYFVAGTSFYISASGGPNVTGLDSLCGLSVGVERGTTQQHDAMTQSKKCTSAGKQPVSVNVFPDQNGANLSLSSGRVQVVMADSPVAAYAVEQSNGQFKLSGSAYGTAPYGIAVPRPSGTAPGEAPLTKPILDAMNKLIQDGVYAKILDKWGLQQGAISQAKVNAAVF